MGKIKLKYIDLFAGCGGLSLGLYNTGIWEGIFAIEKSPDAFLTLKYNLIEKKKHFDWPEWLPQKEHDINEILKNNHKELLAYRGKVDLVAGGPPCQGFSTAGRRNENDDRNSLVKKYNELPRRRAAGYLRTELTVYFYAKLYILFQVLGHEHTS